MKVHEVHEIQWYLLKIGRYQLWLDFFTFSLHRCRIMELGGPSGQLVEARLRRGSNPKVTRAILKLTRIQSGSNPREFESNPNRAVPCRTVPHRAAPHRTIPHRTWSH